MGVMVEDDRKAHRCALMQTYNVPLVMSCQGDLFMFKFDNKVGHKYFFTFLYN